MFFFYYKHYTEAPVCLHVSGNEKMIVSAMIPGSELFTIEANNTNATTPRSVALVATDRLDECGALSEMIFKKDHRIVHLTSGRCIYPKGMSFASIVQKLMIFLVQRH